MIEIKKIDGFAKININKIDDGDEINKVVGADKINKIGETDIDKNSSENKNETQSANYHALRYVVIGLAVGILLKLFVIDFLHIEGASMEPAIRNGETVLVNKLAYGLVKPGSRDFFVQWAEPSAGDVVIYLHDDRIVIKRCAATAGTPLEYSADSGYTLRVGGKSISLTRRQYDAMRNSARVPDGYILALGDNYDESLDSRDYGFVSVKNIVGKVIGK